MAHLHAGLLAVVVLAGEHLGCAVPVQTDAAGQQLVELVHPDQGWTTSSLGNTTTLGVSLKCANNGNGFSHHHHHSRYASLTALFHKFEILSENILSTALDINQTLYPQVDM